MDYDAENKRIHIIELERNITNRFIREEWIEFQEVLDMNATVF